MKEELLTVDLTVAETEFLLFHLNTFVGNNKWIEYKAAAVEQAENIIATLERQMGRNEWQR